MIEMLNEIISGYRTDAERAAVDFACTNMIPSSGYTPPGCIPDSKPLYKCLIQVAQTDHELEYIEKNITHSDGTVYFSFGEATQQLSELKKIADLKSIPFLHIDITENRDLDASLLIKKFCEAHNIKNLHISGSSFRNDKGYTEVFNILDGLSILGIEYDDEDRIGQFDNLIDELEARSSNSPTKEIDIKYNQIENDLEEIFHYYIALTVALSESRKTVYTDTGVPFVEIYDPDLYDPSYYERDAKVTSYLSASIIMLLFSKFEDWIEIICKSIQEKKKIPISRKELEGGIIKTFKKYIKTFGDFTKPDDNEWAVIDAIYYVRNVLVHGGGYPERADSRGKKKLNLLTQMKAGIHIDNKMEYEKQREKIINDNNRITEEKSKIKIRTICDLKRSIDLDQHFIEVPPPLNP